MGMRPGNNRRLMQYSALRTAQAQLHGHETFRLPMAHRSAECRTRANGLEEVQRNRQRARENSLRSGCLQREVAAPLTVGATLGRRMKYRAAQCRCSLDCPTRLLVRPQIHSARSLFSGASPNPLEWIHSCWPHHKIHSSGFQHRDASQNPLEWILRSRALPKIHSSGFLRRRASESSTRVDWAAGERPMGDSNLLVQLSNFEPSTALTPTSRCECSPRLCPVRVGRAATRASVKPCSRRAALRRARRSSRAARRRRRARGPRGARRATRCGQAC